MKISEKIFFKRGVDKGYPMWYNIVKIKERPKRRKRK